MKKKMVGRKLGKMHYIHRSAILFLDQKEQITLKRALLLTHKDLKWNLSKVSLMGDSVSLLFYKEFDTALFPTLTSSTIIKINESSIKSINYEIRENPPVLHRKELMLPPNDPRVEDWAKITKFCEDKGLFKSASYIGTIKKWEQRLKENKFKVEGQKIISIV